MSGKRQTVIFVSKFGGIKPAIAYRTHMSIIGDILATTRDDIPDESGASVTYLIRKANISHGRISKILETLVQQGLLEQRNSDRACRYKKSKRKGVFTSLPGLQRICGQLWSKNIVFRSFAYCF